MKSNSTFALAGRQRTLGSSFSTVGSKAAAQLEKIPGRMICDDGVDFFQVQLPYASPEDIQQAIVMAMAHQQPPELQLPEPGPDDELAPAIARAVKPFEEEDFVRVVVDQFGGTSDLHGIYRHLEGEIPRARLQDINRTIKGRDQVTADGVTYKVVRVGTGYRLEQNTEIPEYQEGVDQYSGGTQPVFQPERANGLEKVG